MIAVWDHKNHNVKEVLIMNNLITNDLVNRQYFPTYFPTVTSDSLQKWLADVEQLFKQPIKEVFPYPIDVKKVFSSKTGKLIKLVFDVALAGLTKDYIKVQLKKGKFLTIKIEKPEVQTDEKESDEEIEYVVLSKALSYRDGEITFRIFNEIDTEKFNPTFKNGLLEIELYIKEQAKDDDVITASIE